MFHLRGWIGEIGWLKTFTEAARPGAYLSVIVPGFIAGGDAIDVVHRPEHDVTVQLAYRATTTARELLPRLRAAGDEFIEELRDMVEGGETITLDG